MTVQPHLVIEGVSAGYGDVAVLHGISFNVPKSSIIAIVGANGAGKTTLLATIAGLIKPTTGCVSFAGHDISKRRADELPEMGLVLVPEGGRLFPFMTVRENLELGAYARSSRPYIAQRLEEVQEIFPILRDRQSQMAGKLSGGERQMCAIARALMSKPQLVLLDEPSVGLSPLMVEKVLETVSNLAAKGGPTVVIVEQRVTEVLEIAHEAHILDHGRFVRSGPARAMLTDPMVQETYMGL
jgi:branched-chain amino acid transport system ATP-binding protein